MICRFIMILTGINQAHVRPTLSSYGNQSVQKESTDFIL